MLKHRILTALVLLPIFILLLFKLPPIAFCVFTGLVVVWGAWEWSLFMGLKSFPSAFFYPIGMIFMLIIALELPILALLYSSLLWWVFAFVLVASYPKATSIWSKSIILRGLMGFFVLIPCWLAVNYIRNAENGIYILLFLFVLIWGADIGAYFAGKKWGKHKLAPAVSPGKSWEGLCGALFVTLIIVVTILYFLKLPFNLWVVAIALSFITVLFSVLGDLFESMLKRNVNIKDSGQLLPGHGGILDRIDSLTAAAPIFTVGAILIGKFFY